MRQRKSMDGFVTRRPQRSLLNDSGLDKTKTTVGHMRTDKRQNVEVHTGDGEQGKQMQSGHGGDLQQSIGESLREIDFDDDKTKKRRRRNRKKRKIAKITGLILGLVAMAVVGFMAYKAWHVGSQVFKGDMLGIFQQQELKMDQHGRSNVLVLGSTDDMPGRDGADLTDSMMVLSVDQKKKDAYMFSIPRDLWVKYDRACLSGYEGKINAFYACAKDDESDSAEKAAMDTTREFVGKIFDMDIQYVAHINTVVIRDSVNAMGGITVNVQSDDDRGVLDATFDDMCRDAPNLCPGGHYLEFKNGPNEMNGNQAMAFSQARGMTMPTYGLAGSNFDREKNQQLVLMALKEKATSSGTLTDIGKVMGLMEAMGSNLRTNIDPKEVQTIMKVSSEMATDQIKRLSFINEDSILLTTGAAGGQAVVQPVAGLYDFSEIRQYLKKSIFATDLTREEAKVAVLNGGGVSGAAQEEAEKLKQLGLEVVFVGNAPEGAYKPRQFFRTGIGDKTFTLTTNKLHEMYGTIIDSNGSELGLAVEADFVVVIGPSLE